MDLYQWVKVKDPGGSAASLKLAEAPKVHHKLAGHSLIEKTQQEVVVGAVAAEEVEKRSKFVF